MSWELIILFFLIVIIVVLIGFIILSKLGPFTGKAKIGAWPLTFELEMRTEKRQISDKDFSLINVDKFHVNSSIGFVVHKPFSKEWSILEPSKREFLKERGFSKDFIDLQMHDFPDPDKNIKILIIKRGPIQSVQYTKQTKVDGRRFPSNYLGLVKKILLDGQEKTYDQIVIQAINRKIIANELPTLFDVFSFATRETLRFGSKKVFVNRENTVFLLDCSAKFENIKYNGKLGNRVLNNIVLTQENSDYIFLVHVNYVQAPEKPTKVWDELREYLNSFRVLVK